MLFIIKVQNYNSLGEIMYKLNDEDEKRKFVFRERLTFTLFLILGIYVVIIRYAWYFVQFWIFKEDAVP
jgi:hypothetical protein